MADDNDRRMKVGKEEILDSRPQADKDDNKKEWEEVKKAAEEAPAPPVDNNLPPKE